MPTRARTAVAIPAHDEVDRIPIVLGSLAAQEGFGPDRRLPVTLLANNCRDDTAEIAAAFAASPAGAALDLEVLDVALQPEEAHVGTARRMAMDAAAERAGGSGIVLTTDADARLPPAWVAANVEALRDAEIVGGRLIVDADVADSGLTALHSDIERYWSAVRAIEECLDPQAHDPAPRHGDHTGASLALRVETYRFVGGLPPLPRREDNALVARVVQSGGRLRHDPRVSVLVSDRAIGRVGGGMADDMARRRAVLSGADTYALPEPAHWRWSIGRRASLRAAWALGLDASEAALVRVGLCREAVAKVRPRDCPNGIAFVERAQAELERVDPPARLVPLADALAAFAALRSAG